MPQRKSKAPSCRDLLKTDFREYGHYQNLEASDYRRRINPPMRSI